MFVFCIFAATVFIAFTIAMTFAARAGAQVTLLAELVDSTALELVKLDWGDFEVRTRRQPVVVASPPRLRWWPYRAVAPWTLQASARLSRHAAFTIVAARLTDTLLKRNDVEVGDTAFDEAWRISAVDDAVARVVVGNPAVKSAITALMQSPHISRVVVGDDGRLVVDWFFRPPLHRRKRRERSEPTVNDIESQLDLLRDLVVALEATSTLDVVPDASTVVAADSGSPVGVSGSY